MGVRGVATTKSETSSSQWRLVPAISPFRHVHHMCLGNQARTVKQDTEKEGARQDEAMEE